jgi:ABC-2 type transport system permease protein
MNTTLTPAVRHDAGSADAAAGVLRPTRPFRWSVRRELWENRSIYLAPVGVAAFAVVALVIHAVTMPSHMPGLLGNDPGQPRAASGTYRVVASLMLLASFVVGAFYCLEALSAERRDRSILFWKSLPVSDRTTVLAKATVPLLVLPAVTLVLTVAAHATLFLLSVLALAVQGQGPGALWRELSLFRLWGMLLYTAPLMTVWLAPVYAFLLLVSGWARRTAVLWVVLPLLALGVLEKLTMDTLHVAAAAGRRVFGWYTQGFAGPVGEHVLFGARIVPSPGRFLGSPDPWIGLVAAAAFLAVAMRIRRDREPI